MKSVVEKIYHDQSQKGQGIFWSDDTHSWIVLDPEIAISIMRSGQFLVNDFKTGPIDVAQRTGIDIKRILDGLRDAPLSNNGEAHRKARRRFAAALTPNVDAAAKAFESGCSEQLEAILSTDGESDLFADLLLPAMNGALKVLGGRQIDAERFRIASPTQLFSTSQIFSGPRLAKLNSDISEAPADENAPECPHLMTLFAGDPTLGSLGQSLIHHLRSNPGARLRDIDWASEFTRTSLPFAERKSISEVQFGGITIKKDDAVSVYLGAFCEDGRLHFGTGLHRCLGEPLAKQMWTRLTSLLSLRNERLEIEDVVYRGADFAFVMPIKIQVRVSR